MSGMTQLIIFGTIIVCVLAGSAWLKRNRQRKFLSAAAAFGFVPAAEDDGNIPVAGDSPLFEHHGNFAVVAKGNWNGLECCLFDYTYSRGHSRNGVSITQTVASFMKPGINVPIFQVRPRHFNFSDRLANFISREGVEMKDAPEFSRRFVVHLAIPDVAQQLFTAEVRSFFEQLPEWNLTLEGCGEAIMVYEPGKTVNIDKLETFLQCSGDIVERLRAVIPATVRS